MRNFILMTALPPTLGHKDLIDFASNLPGETRVILVRRNAEPYREERVIALRETFRDRDNVRILTYDEADEKLQGNEPWVPVLQSYGFQPGDRLVASETWGSELAEMLNGTFFPYDKDRTLRYTRATNIRENLYKNWDWILPEFQKKITRRVVLFGAESTGKTTLAKALAEKLTYAQWLFEYARPYLETTEGPLTIDHMFDIWYGQKALQESMKQRNPQIPLLIQDTDLYSTSGYWEFWQPDTVPEGLLKDVENFEANLYLLLPSNIPFEADSIRYGENAREKDDEYWEGVLIKAGVKYEKLTSDSLEDRIIEAETYIQKILPSVEYERTDK